MKLHQKVVLVLVAACLFFSALGLVRGDFQSAALGVFVSACALLTNGMWPTKWLWRRGKIRERPTAAPDSDPRGAGRLR